MAIERSFGPDYDFFIMPVRQQISTDQGVFLLMPCYKRASGRVGIKFVAVADRSQSSDCTVQASYILFDAFRAHPQISMAANWLTDLRTAATSFVATKFLARADARVLGIFGTGRQARAHIQVFTQLREFDRVLVCGSSVERTAKFAGDLRRESGINAEVVAADLCAMEAEIICTCTTARTPLFDGKLLRPGTHLNLVGAFQPQCREVDSLTIRRARVAVDSYAGALMESGDLLIPLNEGAITREHISAELHDIVSGNAARLANEITVFKSLGCALEDFAMAELLVRKLEHETK